MGQGEINQSGLHSMRLHLDLISFQMEADHLLGRREDEDVPPVKISMLKFQCLLGHGKGHGHLLENAYSLMNTFQLYSSKDKKESQLQVTGGLNHIRWMAYLSDKTEIQGLV